MIAGGFSHLRMAALGEVRKFIKTMQPHLKNNFNCGT
jgi:hypothetical protein